MVSDIPRYLGNSSPPSVPGPLLRGLLPTVPSLPTSYTQFLLSLACLGAGLSPMCMVADSRQTDMQAMVAGAAQVNPG